METVRKTRGELGSMAARKLVPRVEYHGPAPPKKGAAELEPPVKELAVQNYHHQSTAQGCRLLQAGNSDKASGTAISTIRRGQWWNPLDTEFNRGGFRYRQIAREGRFAIYEQRWQDSPSACYEVVRIRRHHGKDVRGHWIEPSEFYPSSSEWGEHGWTFLASDKAFETFHQLVRRRQ